MATSKTQLKETALFKKKLLGYFEVLEDKHQRVEAIGNTFSIYLDKEGHQDYIDGTGSISAIYMTYRAHNIEVTLNSDKVPAHLPFATDIIEAFEEEMLRLASKGVLDA